MKMPKMIDDLRDALDMNKKKRKKRARNTRLATQAETVTMGELIYRSG